MQEDRSSGVSWADLHTRTGSAAGVPLGIDRLLGAETSAEAEAAYWTLDNRVVVQGQLFDSAAPVARTVSKAVCEGRASAHGLPFALDLLFELAAGESDDSVEIGTACRASISEHLGCFYRLVDSDDAQVQLAVLDLLELLDPDRHHVRATAARLAPLAASERVKLRAAAIAASDD